MVSVPVAFITAMYTSWWYLLMAFIWSTIINTVFVQIGMHRYFAHAGFKTGPLRHKFLTIGSCLAGSGSPLSWSTHHIHHHRHSDSTNDLHSPTDGWIHSTFIWPLRGKQYFESKTQTSSTPKHLVKDQTVMWVHRYYFKIWFISILLLGLVSWQLLIFGLLFPAAGCLIRANFLSNTASHSKLPGSYKNFLDTGDQSYNNKLIQFLNIGEGLHNNHHHNMKNYNQAMALGEWDPAAWLIEKFFKI